MNNLKFSNDSHTLGLGLGPKCIEQDQNAGPKCIEQRQKVVNKWFIVPTAISGGYRAEDLVCRPASKRGWVESVCSVQRWRRRLGPTGRWWLRRRPTGRQQRPTGRQRRPTGRWQRWWRRPTGGQGEGREPLEADGPCWGLGLCWNAGHHWRWIPGQRHRTAEQGARSQGARTRLGTWLSRYLVRQPGSQEMRYLGTDRPCSWPGVTFRFSCSLVQEGTVA